MSREKLNSKIRDKLDYAIVQLGKAEKLLSNIAPGVRITKSIALPNLSSSQVEQAISGNKKLIQVNTITVI